MRTVILMLVVGCLAEAARPIEKNQKPAENARKQPQQPPITYVVNAGVAQVSEKQQQQQQPQPVDFAAIAARQQYVPNVNYLSLLEPQFQQYPGYNFQPERQAFPRLQPQFVLIGPGGQGQQPFLLQPGGSPPGNFLIPQAPQPDPNVVRQQPQHPLFIAGYPKPAHIPPIEKDAEEVPTNPGAKIPPISDGGNKPEKLEDFADDRKVATEVDGLNGADAKPAAVPPGQRFFIFKGQNLFPNTDYGKTFLPHGQQNVPQFENSPQIPNFLLRNAINGQPLNNLPQQRDSLQSIHFGGAPHQQPFSQQQFPQQPFYFRSNDQLNVGPEEEGVQFPLTENGGNYFPYQDDGLDNEAVIVEANLQDGASSDDTEAISTPDRQVEPSVSQAAPGAIALAGPKGVAAAAPRGTAIVGRGGLAVSSPQATSVAGPSKNQEEKKKKTK